MKAEVHWIKGVPGRLAIMPRPHGGILLADQLRSLKRQGVDVLASMLTPREEASLGLADEANLAGEFGIRFLSLPVDDMSQPDEASGLLSLAEDLRGCLAAGQGVAVHCLAGIGRSALLLSCVLMKLGRRAEDALKRISAARGFPVPQTAEQREWIDRIEREYFPPGPISPP